MGAEAARRVLVGEDGGLVLGVTWLPPEALDALFWGRASTHAEAMAALVRELSLDMAFVPAEQVLSLASLAAVAREGALGAWAVSGVFGRVAIEVGWTQALARSAGAPGELASPLAQALHEALDDARMGLENGAGALVVADDLAGAAGPLVSPDFALEALLPCYRRLAEEAALAGVPAIFHSDGDVRMLFPALSRAEYSAVHVGGLPADSFPPTVQAARETGLVALGGLVAGELLPGAKALAARTKELLEGGGFIVTDDGGISSVEELAAFVSAVRAVRETEPS